VDYPFNRLLEVKNASGISPNRLRAQIGQKVDATACTVVSAHANSQIPFGILVVCDEADAFLCNIPTTKAQLAKPLGITLCQLHSQHYEPKSSIAVLRKGRVWVEADKVNAPGDIVYIKFNDQGLVQFTGDSKDTTPLRKAIFLEKSDGGLVPIEVNFFGGVA
jgi:hypothetical protein